MPLKIGLLTIATGRYIELLDRLAASARAHFFPGHHVTHFVFTDSGAGPPATTRVPIPHEPWPMVTLKRYHYFADAAPLLSAMDYLFYVDVDMRFVADCGEEILPDGKQGLVGVQHPAFVRRRGWFGARELRSLPHRDLPFERNPRSRACVDDPVHEAYYMGAFNGGRADAFLAMARELREAVDDDLGRGIVALWHDESHLNRYFAAHAPKRLSPAYCYPESGFPHLRPLQPVILALDKDHAYFRANA